MPVAAPRKTRNAPAVSNDALESAQAASLLKEAMASFRPAASAPTPSKLRAGADANSHLPDGVSVHRNKFMARFEDQCVGLFETPEAAEAALDAFAKALMVMVFEVEGPGGRSESISLRCKHTSTTVHFDLPPVVTLGTLRAELFERFGVPPFQQHLELEDGTVLKGDGNNPLDAPFLKLESALEKPLPLRLSTCTDPRHSAEKTAAFVEFLTSTPPKLDLALDMLRNPSGVPIDPNFKATVYLKRDETCVYGTSRAVLPPLTLALWAEPATVDVVEVVEELLAQGADPNLTGDEDVSDGSGMGPSRQRGTLRDVSPLCHAVQRGSVECVRRLLEAGADPNARSATLGPEGGLPQTFLYRGGRCTDAERKKILALLAAARAKAQAELRAMSTPAERETMGKAAAEAKARGGDA